jgi:hypothetical protein
MFQLALLLHNFDKTLWPKCHIQWLYLAAHGCKTYLNLNLNLSGTVIGVTFGDRSARISRMVRT